MNMTFDRFYLEKLACDYCDEYGIDLFDPIRGQIISAFCVGAKIERERCAKVCDEQQFVNSDTEYMQEKCAAAIRNSGGAA